MKKVCYFNSHIFWGGGEKLHLEYAIEFKKKGYQVSLVAGKKSVLAQKGVTENLPVHSLSVGNLSFLNPFKLIQLYHYYKKAQIDTVVFSSSQDLKLGGLAAKLAGVNNIVYLRGLAVEVKGSFMNRFIYSSILTHIIANSEETKRTVLKNLSTSIPAEKVKVIYHGIEVQEAIRNTHKLEQVIQNGKGIILGNAGRLTRQKGQHHLIELAAILKRKGLSFTLFIAGTGELREELETLIEKNQLQNEVVLLGFVKDMEAFMNALDVFVLSSVWEGFGYVLVEAMIKSKPVVAFNITSNPEIVKDKETGFLAPYPDMEAFAKYTSQLIQDESLRQNMGNAGRERVIKEFEIENRITEMEQYLLATSH
jgi:glycosyltransferase involved in cell wall biosynthesis